MNKHRQWTPYPNDAYRGCNTSRGNGGAPSHHDAPVALPNSLMILHTAVNRTSRSGDVIGPEQRVSAYVALKSITDWAAYQLFEEDSKGTLSVGTLADLVILDQNPLEVDPAAIKDIVVLETIKEGVTVYRAR